MSHQETVPPEQQQERQQADDLEARLPDPEVVPKAKRRQFTAKYKLRVLEEADRCTERGQIGELLRREGLYSSHLSKWRQQRARGQLQGLAPKKRGRKGQDPSVAELARLRRENERLRVQLEQAEIIIDVQKKLAQLLGQKTDETESDESEL
jgi:transposase-like protein